MRQIPVGSTDVLLKRVYFSIRLLDDSLALTETGLQPLVSINGGSHTNIGIGVLQSTGFGKYYAELDTGILTTPGDIIQTIYLHNGLTKPSDGDTFQVVQGDGTIPNDTPSVSTYGNVNDADFFFSQRLNTLAWDSADRSTKQKALVQATQIIDRLNFSGDKADDNQELQFPRKNEIIDTSWITPDPIIPPLPGFVFQGVSASGQSFISIDVNPPTEIKQATYLTAFALLDGWDADIEAKNVNAVGDKYGPVTTQYSYAQTPGYIMAGLPNVTVWNLVLAFLRDPHEVDMERAS